MNHNQAVERMSAERYLLDELTPEARDEFEEHMFGCVECAQDLCAAAAFVEEAKVQLPALTENLPPRSSAAADKPSAKQDRRQSNHWFSWWRPGFAAPVFAVLLIVVGYQNLVTFPALSKAASQPRLVPWVPLRGATRGGERLSITADREHGVAFPVDLVQPPDVAPYAQFAFTLIDPQGRTLWTGSISAPASDGRLSLAIPGAILRTGTYTVAVSGIGPQGESTPVERYVFDLRLTN